MKLEMKALVIVLATLLLVLAISSAAWVAAQAPLVEVSLSPATRTEAVGDTFTLDVMLRTNGQALAGLDTFVDFDPAFLEATQVIAGEGSPFNFELNNNVDNIQGHADYSAGTFNPPPTTPLITFATLTFRAKAPTSATALTFSFADPRVTRGAFSGAWVNANTTGATISISGAQPTAAFAADVTSGTAPLTVHFTDSSTGNPTAWLWSFGDGSTSSQQNPIHVYSAVGDYTVTLTITVPGAQPSLTRTAYISAMAPEPTQSPVSTPTPTPGLSPSPTPLPGPTVTVTPTPMPSATPTPLPGITPTGTPLATPAPMAPIATLTESVSPPGKIVTTADGKVSVNLGSGAIAAAGTLRVMQYASSSAPSAPQSYAMAGNVFVVSVTTADGKAVDRLPKPVTITASYSEADLAAAGGDPKRIVVAYHSLPGWSVVTSRVVNASARTITFETDVLGLWALMVSPSAESSVPAAGDNNLLTPLAFMVVVGAVLVASGAILRRRQGTA